MWGGGQTEPWLRTYEIIKFGIGSAGTRHSCSIESIYPTFLRPTNQIYLSVQSLYAGRNSPVTPVESAGNMETAQISPMSDAAPC